jgi:hypothetical protein
MRIIALTAVVALACGAAACETTSAMSESAAERAAEAAPPAASPPSMAPGPQMAYSDEQLRNFIRANSEVSAIASRHTSVLQSGSPEQKAAARAQIQSEALPVLQRHNLDAQTYNAIANAARTDPSVQARLAQLRSSTPGG